MERKQKRREKTKRMTRTGGISPQIAGTATSNTTTTSVAKEAGNATLVGDNRTHSNRESRKNKHSSSKKLRAETRDRVAEKGPLCYGYR